MKRLYTKVLLWFLATVLTTGIGLLWVAAPGPFRGGPPFRRMMPFHLRVALEAYVRGGPQALERHLEVLRDETGMEAFVADPNGKDLVTGQVHPLPPGPPYDGYRNPADGYWFIQSVQGGPPRLGPLYPAHLWVLLSVGLFTVLLSYFLTRPLRELQRAVDRFGQGDLATRIRSERKDEVGQLGESFDRMADRIEALVNAQRRLLADLSHEIRTPLTRLGLAVELARGGEDRDAALDRVQREADRLNSLVAGLLQVARGEADPAAITLIPVQLDELLESIVEECRLEGAQVILKSGQPVTAEGDPELLRRAIENVLRNALKHGAPPIEVGISGTTITIRDHGSGVPEEAIPRLFDAFFRAQPGSAGFGLGLSIAKRAIDLHKGRITAVNANPGLVVQIRLGP